MAATDYRCLMVPEFRTKVKIPTSSQTAREVGHPSAVPIEDVPVHQFADLEAEYCEEDYETEKARRIYRGRTVAMLRKYMRYSIETGRLPSLLGREFLQDAGYFVYGGDV